MVVRYFYAWTPLVAIGAVVLLSMPWLGLIALMLVAIVALAALAALAWAIVLVPYMLVRAIFRHWNTRSGAGRKTAAAPSPARLHNEAGWHGAAPDPAALRVGRHLQAPQHTFEEGHVS